MKKSKQLLLGMTVLTALSGNVYAEEVLPTYDTDATVVTATKSEEKLLHTSADVTVITGKEIEKMHYKTMTDVLKTVPNVQVLNYAQNYTRNKILINGSSKVVVLVNGVRVSQQITDGLAMNYGFNLVRDMQDVARIEVLKGAASVLYGADAKGGVINIITKTPNKTKTTISTERGNFGHEAYSIKQDFHHDKLSISAYARKSLDGDYIDGQGRRWPYKNHNDEVGINGKLLVGKDDSGYLSFNYSNSHTDSAYVDAHKVKPEAFKSKQDTNSLQIMYNQEFDKGWTNNLAYNRIVNRNIFNRYGFDKKTKGFKSKATIWANEKYTTEVINNTIRKVFDEKNKLTFGVEQIKSRNDITKNNKYPTKTTTAKALFTQYSWDFTKNWNLLAGFRRDIYNAGYKQNIKGHNSSSFTLTHDFDDRTNMYVAYNEYFKAPDIDQLFNPMYGNSNLLPEIGNNREIGINHMTKDKTLISAHFFTRHSKNVQKLAPNEKLPSGYYWANSKERAHGFDINVMKSINEKWNVRAGWAHLSIWDENGNYKMGFLPSNSITFGADYKYKKVDAGFQARGFYGRTGKDVDYKAWPSGRYWVADLAVNYRPTKDAKVYMKVNNVFNKDYAFHTNYPFPGPDQYKPNSWYSMPGRSIMLGAELAF